MKILSRFRRWYWHWRVRARLWLQHQSWYWPLRARLRPIWLWASGRCLWCRGRGYWIPELAKLGGGIPVLVDWPRCDVCRGSGYRWWRWRKTALRYHLQAWRTHQRYRAAMLVWRLWRPLLLFDNRTWWAMALTEPVENYHGRSWAAGDFITKDDRVIVSHQRERMEQMARDFHFDLVCLPALPPRYILWEDWVSPLYR